MADLPETDIAPARRSARANSRIIGRVLSAAVLLIILLGVLGYGAVRWLDSDSGRAFIVRQLPLYAPKSGLFIRAGRIDGSIFGNAIIHDITIGDPKGVFATIPELDLDWRPLDLVSNRLTARSVLAREVRVLRKPELRPSADKRILPDIDIDIAKLRIDRLILEAPVIGSMRVLGLGGSADIRAGRARIDLAALTLAGAGVNGGDTVRLKLDSRPDDNIFDVDALVEAPKGGVVTTLLGLAAPLQVKLSGDGSWTVWKGRLLARLGEAPLADFAVNARAGQFVAVGTVQPGGVLHGAALRLLGPRLAVNATARLADRTLDLTARLASPALSADISGGADFASETLRNIAVNARLLQPAALHPRVSGANIQLTARLAGRFADPLVDYRLTADRIAWGATEAMGVRAAGIVRAGAQPTLIPVSLTAQRVSGVGETAGALLTNVRITGPLTLANGQLTAQALAFRSDRMNGTASVALVLGEDRYRIGIKGTLPGYVLPGLGIADIRADLAVTPAANGARVAGTADVQVTRLDNGFFNTLMEGKPRITADIDVAGDLSLSFRNARLMSPGLALTASGTRAPDGFIRLTGSGNSRAYGPVQLVLAGQIDAPTVDLVLARPGLGIGLAGVTGRVAPAAGGWSFDARGGSAYGPASARGLIRTGAGPLVIDLASASVAGVTAHGSLTQTVAGPFAGQLALAGTGLSGRAGLSAAGAVQRVDLAMTARDATLATTTPVTIAAGDVKLVLMLPDAGPSATGSFSLLGVDREEVHVSKADGTLDYHQGRGTAHVDIAGNTSVPFAFNTDIAFAPDRISVSGNGRLDGKPITLSNAAVLTRTAAGWQLAPVGVVTSYGRAELSGLFGNTSAVKARLDGIGLGLLPLFLPGYDLSGHVSGDLDLRMPAGGLPTGTARLRVNGLSRAGIASSSTPIDLGINADLNGNEAVAKVVIVRGGKVEGRVQARLGPFPPGDTVKARLFASPLFAQARYNGPAQAIWGLAGIEALDVRGPVVVAADVSGPLGDPRITGTVRTQGARVESPILGAVVENVILDSRFTGSRLELTKFTGDAGKGGSITGTGGIDLSAERAFPMDIRLQLKNAQLLNRDDLTGTATGRIRIATDEYGGVVSGKLAIDKAGFRIGRAATAEVAVLDVREVNTRALGRPGIVYAKPTRWLLEIDTSADRRLTVSGMGLTSEWRGNLKVTGGATTPELTGRVQLVRGDYDFAGKRFELTKGDIRFQGGYPPDPLIDITAESSSNGFTAQLSISGSGLHPEIKFSSVPALPEDEVLSRVLFGASVTNLSAPEALQLAGALASLRPSNGGGFNPINAVRKGLGIDRLRILPADTTLGRKTAVAAGQYIGRSVYVEVATDAQGYTASNLEVSLTRSLSILSQVATLGGTSVSLKWKKDY